MAAVRSAVTKVISESSKGYPVATSASTPKAVHVLERVKTPVAGRHELDDAVRGMTGVPRRFVELGPAAVVGLDLAGQGLHELRHAVTRHERTEARGADVIDHGTLASGLVVAVPAPRRPRQCRAAASQ